MSYKIREYGHDFFVGTREDVYAEIDRLKALPAEKLGMDRPSDTDDAHEIYTVEYLVFDDEDDLCETVNFTTTFGHA